MRVVGRGTQSAGLAAVLAAAVVLSAPALAQSPAAVDLVSLYCTAAEGTPSEDLEVFMEGFLDDQAAADVAALPLYEPLDEARARLSRLELEMRGDAERMKPSREAELLAVNAETRTAEADFDSIALAYEAGKIGQEHVTLAFDKMIELRKRQDRILAEIEGLDRGLAGGGEALAFAVGRVREWDERSQAVLDAEAALREADLYAAAFAEAEDAVRDCVGDAIDRGAAEAAAPPPGPQVATANILNMQCNTAMFGGSGSSSGQSGRLEIERDGITVVAKVNLADGGLLLDAAGTIDDSGYATIESSFSMEGFDGRFAASGTLYEDPNDTAVLQGNGKATLNLSGQGATISCTMDWETILPS
jgi:hypothetical protein